MEIIFFPSIHLLFHTSSPSVCHSLGAINMAITDLDTKFIFNCASDLRRLEDDQKHLKIWNKDYFFCQFVNLCFMEKFRVLICIKVVYVNNHYAAKKLNF
jgi:hypothetical protein